MSHTRRTFLASLAATALPRALFAADDPRKLAMRIDLKGFGNAGEADIKAVLRSAAGEIWKHCPNSRFEQPGFAIYHNDKYPITHFERSDDGWIVIGLCLDGPYWARFAYQFAHEFCHALADHTNDWRRLWHNPGHANHWLEESFCETASLFSLRAMAKTWETNPPYVNWKDYSKALTNYAKEWLEDPKHQLPAGKTFIEWFRESEPEMRKNGTIRDKNGIVATQLLPLFEAEPRGWESLTTLNLGKRIEARPLADHLAEWKANTRPELQPFVGKIAAVFGL